MSGLTGYLTAGEVAQRLGISPRQVRCLCESGKLPGARKDKGRWLIPTNAHPRMAADVSMQAKRLKDLPAKKRERAIRRLGVIRDFERFCAAAANTVTRSEAIAAYTRHHSDVKARTLYRWMEQYRRRGVKGLVDMRGGDKSAARTISEEAFEHFKAMWLTEQRLSVKLCWRNICYTNRSEDMGWAIPSLRQMHRIVDERIPLPVAVLHREGLAAYQARCAPYIEVDPDSVEPGEVWVGDHSQFNCWIRHRGTWIRPWVTAWQDYRSRAIIGWHISASPNQTTILLAAKRAIEKHGPPDSAKIDNGRDYDSEMWTGTTKTRRRVLGKGYIDETMVAGIYAMMGIGVSFAIKYHPQSKPLERFFDTADQQLTKTLATYCGKDTDRRPENLAEYLKTEKAIGQAYDLESFAELVGRYVELYNNTAHTGRGMNGRTPAEVLAGRSSQRVLADGVLDLLMRVWSGELTVGKNGVKFKGLWYGQYNEQLFVHQGRKVRVAYDPDDLRSVHIYDAVTWKLICIAEQNQLISYGRAVDEQNLRAAMRQKSRAVKIARSFRDSRLTANTDLASLTMRAMAEAAKEPPAHKQPVTLRPVRTPLDNQVAEHKRHEALKAVKRAAGAENMKVALDIDFSVLGGKTETVDLGIFDDE